MGKEELNSLISRNDLWLQTFTASCQPDRFCYSKYENQYWQVKLDVESSRPVHWLINRLLSTLPYRLSYWTKYKTDKANISLIIIIAGDVARASSKPNKRNGSLRMSFRRKEMKTVCLTKNIYSPEHLRRKCWLIYWILWSLDLVKLRLQL